jgi:hypothetical protein
MATDQSATSAHVLRRGRSSMTSVAFAPLPLLTRMVGSSSGETSIRLGATPSTLRTGRKTASLRRVALVRRATWRYLRQTGPRRDG